MSKEYSILYDKYQKLLQDENWTSTLKLRLFLDKIKLKIGIKKEKKTNLTNNPFELLLNEYTALLNSKVWFISHMFKKKQEEKVNIVINDNYSKWIEKNESIIRPKLDFKYNPLFSIVIPVYNVDSKYLKECLDSVRFQYYQNYEIIIVNDCSTKQETIDYLKSLKKDDAITIINCEKNGGISAATNIGIKASKGDYVAFLDDDDTIAPNALYEIVKELNIDNNICLFYSDEDKISSNNIRYMPYFKPDYSPDLILNNNYICHFLVVNKQLCNIVGDLCTELDGAQDYDFVLRCIENISVKQIKHISKVLYHWRAIKGSTSLSRNEKDVDDVTKKTKERALERRKIDAYIEDDGNIFYKNDKRKVSIIIPSKDNFILLKQCINSIINVLNYDNYEIIIVDNGSTLGTKEEISKYIKEDNRIRYIYKKMDFNFSKSCKIGVDESKGDYLLFLNDDIEIVKNDLLQRMIGYCKLPHVGAVGTKLLFPNSTIIQHCGIISTFPCPMHYLYKQDDKMIYANFFNRIVTDVIGVTGACLMVEKNKLKEVGMFDEQFNNDYNDVDLCFKLFEHGYYNVCLNNVYSYHHEYASRKKDNDREILKNCRTLYDKHPNLYVTDPFYNDAYNLGSDNFEY